MSVQDYLSMAFIPLLVAFGLGYYSVKLLVYKDTDSIRGQKRGKLKNKEQYTKNAGWLMAFLAAASLVMAILMYFDMTAATVEIVACIVIFGILWNRMNAKYGE